MMYNSRIRQLIRQNMAAGQIEEYNEYKDKYRIKKTYISFLLADACICDHTSSICLFVEYKIESIAGTKLSE